MPVQSVEQNWLKIAARASLIWERLDPTYRHCESALSDQVAQARLQRWCETAAQGDWQRFGQRLARDGLDPERVRPALGHVAIAADQIPPWVKRLREALEIAQSLGIAWNEQGAGLQDRCFDPGAPIPFEELFLPFVELGRQRLLAAPEANYARLSERCQASLDRDLLRWLSFIGARTFFQVFSAFRAIQRQENSVPPGRSAKYYYNAFIAQQLQGGLGRLLEDYSVLARLLMIKTNQWVETTLEFLDRLQADWSAIQCLGGANTPNDQLDPFEQLALLDPGLSDPHCGGRTVIALTFKSGLKVVYKPRDLGIEHAYEELIGWLNARGLNPPLLTRSLLDRSTHGWALFVEPQPCRNHNEARQFYHRAGMLLALFYALSGIDYHHENMIAAGAHPVPIDHEMLMSPLLQTVEDLDDPDQPLKDLRINDSVLDVGLLPLWERGPDGALYDISGLGAGIIEAEPQRLPRWSKINTDLMERTWETAASPSSRAPNLPMLIDGTLLPPQLFVEQLTLGFKHMYRLLLTCLPALLQPSGPLRSFKGLTTRFTFRKTALYWALLERSLAPKLLRDGAEYTIHLELLSRAFTAPDTPIALWPILQAEQRALAQLDIPYFPLLNDSRDLRANGVLIDRCFVVSGYQSAMIHLGRLSEEDLQEQICLIRLALANMQGISSQQARTPAIDDTGDTLREALPPQQLITHAIAIGELLSKRAIRSAGGVTWLQFAYDMRIGRYRLKLLGDDFYSGVCGVALYLAALGAYINDPRYRQLALDALQPLRKALVTSTKSAALRSLGIGGAAGLGGMCYALARMSGWCEETALLDDALRVAAWITPEKIDQDQALDVISGAAGALLSLLALYETCGESTLMDQALACGHQLLERRVQSPSGLWAWPTLEGKLLTGFSHGAAGIAYALLRLAALTSEKTFHMAAIEAIRYEQSLFDPNEGNWPDLRSAPPEMPHRMVGWCHGAPGIGLARLAGLPMVDTPAIRAEIEAALATTQRFHIQDLDQLCCGNLGRAEFLLAAATALKRPSLGILAQQQTAQIVGRAEQQGGYRLNPMLQPAGDCYEPGLFQGLAGIGYTLLRMADPSKFPVLLLWA